MSASALQRQLEAHVDGLRACALCPKMHRPSVSGGAVVSRVMTVGQAPGSKEPVLGRPFAWTAGKTLFRWFEEGCGIREPEFRESVYMAAVCRCFPGKNSAGGDRVPDSGEIATCAAWLRAEVRLLQPQLVIPIGKLAIEQFLPAAKLADMIGKKYVVPFDGQLLEVVPLPHPSGASPWHRMEPGRTLLQTALGLIAQHPAWKNRTGSPV